MKAAERQGVDLPQLPLSELQTFCPLIGDDVYAVLSVEGSLASRNPSAARHPARSVRPSRAPDPSLPDDQETRQVHEIIRERAGAGATSTVFLGRDPFAQRDVAIKVATPEALRTRIAGRVYSHLF